MSGRGEGGAGRGGGGGGRGGGAVAGASRGRGRGGGRLGGGGGADGGGRGDALEWQRSAGAFSAKAKKAYLKWKRAQKAAAGESSSEEGEEGGPSAAAPPRPPQRPPQRPRVEGGGGGGGGRSAPYVARAPPSAEPPVAIDAPFVYAQLDELPPPPGTNNPAARLARLQLQDVGMLPRGGSSADATPSSSTTIAGAMPLRPAWRGVARTAEQLHALEEASFESWEREQRATGAGFFEERLDFWRELWRTAEMSDVLLLVVDARCPLLHFPEGLYDAYVAGGGGGCSSGSSAPRRRLPALLLLNKADLLPPGCADAWAAYMRERYPALSGVRPVCARGGRDGGDGGKCMAREVVEAVLRLRVRRGGAEVAVRDVVGLETDALIAESTRRNTHAKRAVVALDNTRASRVAAAAATTSDGGSGDDGDGWDVHVAGKAGSRRRRRQRRQHVPPPARAGVGRGRGRGSDGSSDGDGDGERSGGGEEEDSGDDGHDSDGGVCALLEALTLEAKLAGGGEEAEEEEDDDEDRAGAAAAASHNPAAARRSGRDRHDHRHDAPIVVGLVGEPNVGKSSSLNALLGAHRAAVSRHPGRTKARQTHYMSARLVVCDCPGLVFARRGVPLPMQVLYGSFPIAACREPYAVLRYLAERAWPRLHALLRLAREDGSAAEGVSDNKDAWTPLALAEALAARRGWRSRRGGRPDASRAANWLLRAALGGERVGEREDEEGTPIGLALLPPSSPSPRTHGQSE